MGKKSQNPKLKPRAQQPKTMLSVFNQHADRVTLAKRKKIEKVGDTKQRVLEAKKANKMVKVSKRNSRFALLEDGEQERRGLTHRGKKISELEEYNDMYFGSEGEEENEEFQDLAEKAHFEGFEEEEAKKEDDSRPKSKSEIYKEIIQKSKLHRHLRSQIYEQNFEKATELDKNLPELIPQLQFRTQDTKIRERLQNADKQFDKLAGELKQDEMVMSNKVIESGQKYTDRVKRKKAEQLHSLMEESSEEQDVRGWARNGQGSEEGYDEEEEEDEIDEVQLSSGEEQSDGEEEEDQQEYDQDLQDDQQQCSEEEQQEEQQESEQQQEPSPQPQPKNGRKPRHRNRK